MDFFIAFFKKLKEISAGVDVVKITPHVEINSANVIDIMGPRIKPCQLLIEFIEKHFCKLSSPDVDTKFA